ncbi:Rpn family recombination-promoting nuclease/putative transposase [Butyrivibrio sp. MC2021]|uniref:Rpn family recombination-promoting nuclease/putative transposase n=1 Tax=Butyrivibrio sp. MC2021 TaxID=1408306 RepID=UPI00047911DE|nr:Rpn family recombination-promoting nuclease/putative transposase [Butyrivibrio sp. MC2021]
MGNSESINRKYKDRLFNYIFGREENREWTLSLYNAVNGSNYTDPDLIEFNTLSDVLFMGMKNDTSFLVSDIMSVYEHQSSLNLNMPLRMLQYVGDLYSGYIAKNKLNKYGTGRIMLPIPKLVTFYNGEQDAEDEMVLKLSDSFAPEHKYKADIEVKVRMINVNYSSNKELMKSCKPLAEYSWFVDTIRRNKTEHGLDVSVAKALDQMPSDFVIKDFLVKHRQEVEGMLDTEYKEAEVMELFKEDGRKEGIAQGIELEKEQSISMMLSRGKTPEEIVDFCGYPLEMVLKVQEELEKVN